MNERTEALWQPSLELRQQSRLTAYMNWLASTKGLGFNNYQELWAWSVDDIQGFWRSIIEFFGVETGGDLAVALMGESMPDVQWFPDATLNYCTQLFTADPSALAIISRSEQGGETRITLGELKDRVTHVAQTLRSAGVRSGDRVAAYLPNWPETVVAFLAAASIGAIWACCAPDMGVGVVADRFVQIEPKVLIATDSYQYNGRLYSRQAEVAALCKRLPSLDLVVHVPGPAWNQSTPGSTAWAGAIPWPHHATEFPHGSVDLPIEPVAFGHPLWVVFSSGTTGLPKPMVHSHGGIVLTHLKTLGLQHDLQPGDRFMFLGGPGWIVWNFLVGGLLTGSTVILYDGHPNWPDARNIWLLVEELAVTHFGCGAAFLTSAMRSQLRPSSFAGMARLKALISTGSPLPEEAYFWAYEHVKSDLWLCSISGGTDIASGFVACAPTLNVYPGEIQCRELGVAAYAFDEQGRPVVDQVGELVVTKPMPSMPVFFWGDRDHARYTESYFDTYAGAWRHGDWVRITARGTAIIYGRSDATINRHGIRMGTAEIYRAVESLDFVADSLVVDLEYLGRKSFLPLFVVLKSGLRLSDDMRERIARQIREIASPRHVPDAIVQVDDVPRTLTGKKIEVPIRKILLGAAASAVAAPETLANPGSLSFFVEYAKSLTGNAPTSRETPTGDDVWDTKGSFAVQSSS